MATNRKIIQQENLNRYDENSEEHMLLVTNVRSLKKPPSPKPKGKKLPLREAKNNANKALSDTALQHQSDGSTTESDNSENMPIKLGPERFGCPFCSTEMSWITNMRRHIMIHTGESPFSCNVCGRSFIRKTDLARHVLVHTGEQPFSCQYCGKSFIRKDRLVKHEFIHKSQ